MERVWSNGLVESDFETHFASGQDVYVQALVEEDGIWLPREGAGFLGMVTPGQAFDAADRPCAGIQVLPYHKIPRGNLYSNGAPWSVTGDDFLSVLNNGEKVHWKFAVRRAAPEEVTAVKRQTGRAGK